MCDGDWHHTYGVAITNIDNPGWQLSIDLADTYLTEIQFAPVVIQRDDEHDWLNCARDKHKFVAHGGPLNLDEMLTVFLDWAEGAYEKL